MPDIFARKEAKYMMTKEQFRLLTKTLNEFLVQDKYFEYTISNIYYDTDNFELFRRSIDKPVYKEKLRLRSYGTPSLTDKAFLEIKKKYGGIVYKRRIDDALQNIYSVLDNPQNIVNINSNISNKKEIEVFLNRYDVKPKVYLSYDRRSYFWKDNKDLRITFDTNIKYRFDKLGLELGTDGKKLLDDNTILMEIKSLNNLPLEFCKVLSNLQIFPTSFSKIGAVYKKELI